MARLDRLSGPSKEVAQIASVVGREFDRSLLAQVAPLELRGSTPPCADFWRPSSW